MLFLFRRLLHACLLVILLLSYFPQHSSLGSSPVLSYFSSLLTNLSSSPTVGSGRRWSIKPSHPNHLEYSC